MKPGQAYWSLIEPFCEPLDLSWDDGPEEFIRLFRSFPPEVGHLYAGEWCQSEIFNGGLLQFFFNSTGILAPEAVEGFKAVGLTAWANALSEAISFFGQPYPREREVRLQQLPKAFQVSREEFDPFAELDEQFDECIGEELPGFDDPTRWELAADRYAMKFGAEPGTLGERGKG
jgi:hypothetical protein